MRRIPPGEVAWAEACTNPDLQAIFQGFFEEANEMLPYSTRTIANQVKDFPLKVDVLSESSKEVSSNMEPREFFEKYIRACQLQGDFPEPIEAVAVRIEAWKTLLQATGGDGGTKKITDMLNDVLHKIGDAIEKTRQRVDALEQTVSNKFDTLDEKLDQLDEKLDYLSKVTRLLSQQNEHIFEAIH